MRRHAVSKMYTYFIYNMYINLFQKRYLANGLARKTKILAQTISHYNELRMVEDTLRIKAWMERQTSKI